MKVGGYLGLGAFALCLIIAVNILGSASAQQPVEAALVRGQFSSGDDTWAARDFGWFYYDADKDVGGEQLSVDVEGRLAEKGHIVYSSHAWPSQFEYKPWGSYDVIALLGKHYLAGYPASSFTDEVSALGKGELREVLIDNKDVHTLSYNQSLTLLGGYVLALKEISQGSDVANLVLFKNQKPVHMAAVSTGDTYVFKIQNIPIILVHLAKSMRGNDSGIIEADGIFQISDGPNIKLTEGIKIGNMELTDLSENRIEFRNDNDLSLTRDTTVPLLDGLELVVLDEPNLIYYPQGSISDYGIREIRGPVYTADSILPLKNPLTGANVGQVKARWSFDNFSGLYFDTENLIGSEMLFIQKLSGRSIAPIQFIQRNGTVEGVPGDLQYITFVQRAKFKFEPWGYYNVIGFFGQPWFAGYSNETSSDIGNVNTISQFRIGQLIQDSDESIHLNAGKALTLGEDYTFYLVSVNEDKAAVALFKNGLLVESAVLKANSTYRYKKDVGDVKDLPIIALHVQNVFTDGRNESIVVDGLFQVSEKNYLPVDWGRKFDKLEIIGSPAGTIVMVNSDSINLDKDTSVSVLPGINIRTADNDTLRYYPYTLQYVVPRPRVEGVDYPRDIASSGQANFSMIVQAGAISQVIAEIEDPSGRRAYFRDLTNLGLGSEDLWIYFWAWDVKVLRMSDDNSPVLDAGGSPVLGLLYLNKSSAPLQVGVTFDSSGRIASIADNRAIYYLSPTGYRMVNTSQSYSEMLANSTSRERFIKIEPGQSLLKFSEVVNGTTSLSSSNHTLTGSIESLEPHAVPIGAPPGRYEIRARVQNAVNAIRVSGVYFNVTASASNAIAGPMVSLGSSTVKIGEQASVPLKVYPPGEKRIEIRYDPAVLNATGVSGPCDISSKIDRRAGNISIVMPGGCSSTNLTFVAKNVNTMTRLNVTKVEGFMPEKVVNGSITVVSSGGKKSDAPAFAVALVALVIMALARRRG